MLMIKHSIPAFALLASGLFTAAQDADGPSVRDGYRQPAVVMPYAWTKPIIDGVVDDAEWMGAASVNAMQTTKREVSVRQTRFWFMWDEDNLYLAMRSPLRPGERVIQNLRKRERDINVVFDDSYEIWLDVDSTDPKTGLDCFYQFLCNFAGARMDVIHLPSVGNSRIGWTCGWEPKNRITQNNEWEWELVIPRDSIGKQAPFTEGTSLTCLVARNFKRPWEQNSFEGTSVFSVNDTHARFTLSKTAPTFHLLSIGNSKSKRFGLELATFGQKDSQVHWRFASDGGIVKTGRLNVKKAQVSHLDPFPSLDEPGEGSFRITVTAADGKTNLLDWCSTRAFGFQKDDVSEFNDRGDVVKLRTQFNPVHNYVRVTGDFINYDNREAIDRVLVEVDDSRGKTLAEANLEIDQLAYVDGVLHPGNLPFGEYTTKLTCLNEDGGVVLTETNPFSKKDHAKAFNWWNTKHGNIERVIEPWTPVTFDGKAFGVWGRKMTVGGGGLPKQIVSSGTPLLAAPMQLVAELSDGTTLTMVPSGAKPAVAFNRDHRKTVEYVGKLGDLTVRSEVLVEFDGMYKLTTTLDPGRTDNPPTVKSVKLVVPFTHEAADYVHAAGEGIRTGFHYGFLPRDQNGAIWTSRKVDSQPMLVGSFIPYIWVGSPKGGLCWFADSDEGWAPSHETPAIEIRRNSEKSVDMVFNLISEDFEISEPRTITFAFQASPVKRMHEQWRMDSWWCGDTFIDYASTGSVIWLAIPYCRDIEKCKDLVAGRHKSTNQYIFGLDKYRANAVPYFIHQALPPSRVPELSYFGDQWQTSVSHCLYYGKTLIDYMVHNYGEWCKATGIDGYYVDNMRPVACDNIEAGRGYRLPDGRIQPTYQMFSTRRYFLRIRAAFAEQGKHNKIVLHMTNNMIIPWVGAADVAYDGEHHVIYPEMNKDFMDFWSLERMRVDFPGQWGTAVNFMHEYQGRWDPNSLLKAARAFTGMVILHDALPSGNANAVNRPLWIGRDRFGIEADDVQFLGYWEEDTGASCDTKDVYLAVWNRPGKLLLAVVNIGEKTDARVKLDAKKLGLAAPGKWQVTDAEEGTSATRRLGKVVGEWLASEQDEIRHQGGGSLTVPVERHDYRQIIVESGK